MSRPKKSRSSNKVNGQPSINVQQNILAASKGALEILREDIPDASERILSAIERQQEHDKKCDDKVLEQRDKELAMNNRLLGQQGKNGTFSFIILLIIISGLFFFLNKRDYVAATTFTGVITALGFLVSRIKAK